MLCPKCGAENPDGSRFCKECGLTLTPDVQSAPLNVSGSVPQQNFSQQNIQPQPVAMASAPVFGNPVMKQRKKLDKKTIIIITVAAVLVVFLILLFAVIIPSATGLNGKIKHIWQDVSYISSSKQYTLDFKNNIETRGTKTYKFKWTKLDNNHIKLSYINDNDYNYYGYQQYEEFYYVLVTFSNDGKTMILIPSDESYNTNSSIYGSVVNYNDPSIYDADEAIILARIS